MAVPSLAAAERLPVRVVTTADGLPRDQLACVVSDARGFVWFCTADGLVRFDGHSAVTFGRSDGLDPPALRTALKTADGQFLVGADGGVFEFRTARSSTGPRFRRILREDKQPTGAVNGLVEGRDGTVWCATGRGLLRLRRSADAVQLTEVDIGLPHRSENDRIVRVVAMDDSGTLWIGAGSGLYARRPDGTTLRLTAASGLPVDEVWSLAFDADGRLWAATREGLVLIDRRTEPRPTVRHVYSSRDGLPASNVKALYTNGRALWVGTVAGVAEAFLSDTGALEIARSLTGFYAWGITVDARGDVWFATDRGAYRLVHQGFTTYLQADGLTAARVSSLFETRDGTLCATTMVGRISIACFDGRRFNDVPIRGSAINNPGWGWSQLVLQDRSGRWWVPTGSGLLQYPAVPARWLTSTSPAVVYDTSAGLHSNTIFRVFEDATGHIWISTFADDANGLARIDGQTGALRVFGRADGLPEDLPIVHAFAEDRQGSIWIGLEAGRLLRYRDGRFEPILVHDADPAAGPLNYEHLRAMLVDRRGTLWIASNVSGLGRVTDTAASRIQIHWYTTGDGLSSNTVWALAEHPSGDIFVANARGIDRFSPGSERVTHFSADEGVPRAEIWGAMRDRAGRIWFATTDGATSFAGDERPSAPPPITLVTAIRIGGEPQPIDADGATVIDQITVVPGGGRLEIEYASPAARAADGVRYQHRLEGVERDWTTTDARVVSLGGTAPGRYHLVIRAARADGAVGAPATVEFEVLAPIWRRWWFNGLLAAGVAAAAVAMHQARINRLLEIERLRARIAADLHDHVGTSLSRIAILSELVRRQAESALPAAVPTLASIANNARELMNDMSDVVWFVDPRLDTLEQILIRIRAFAGDLFDAQQIAWTIDAPAGPGDIVLSPDHRRHVYLVLKESLTNVVRHAHASRVRIEIKSTNGRLTVSVTDDGVGIGAAAPFTMGGRGLSNLRKRSTALGGSLLIEPGDGGRGTRVVLNAPLGPA